MRSDRVFDALQTLRNRYMLCQLASKATRKFHRPSTRIQETMNGVLDRIAGKERQEVLSEPENFAEAQGGLLKAAPSACLLVTVFCIVFLDFVVFPEYPPLKISRQR
jgi:hypothetical protein